MKEKSFYWLKLKNINIISLCTQQKILAAVGKDIGKKNNQPWKTNFTES